MVVSNNRSLFEVPGFQIEYIWVYSHLCILFKFWTNIGRTHLHIDTIFIRTDCRSDVHLSPLFILKYKMEWNQIRRKMHPYRLYYTIYWEANKNGLGLEGRLTFNKVKFKYFYLKHWFLYYLLYLYL